jgi:hypothetical protein
VRPMPIFAVLRVLVPGAFAGDRAPLLIGFTGGFRRSELAALAAEDIEFLDDSLRVLLRRSKTDPEGTGCHVGIPCGSNPKPVQVARLSPLAGNVRHRHRRRLSIN